MGGERGDKAVSGGGEREDKVVSGEGEKIRWRVGMRGVGW